MVPPATPSTGASTGAFDRRSVLRAIAGAGAAGVAGCTQLGPGDDPEPQTTDTPEEPDDPPVRGERVTFLDAGETAAIRTKLDADADPWAAAWAAFEPSLLSAMTAEPRSVVDNGAPAGGDGDPHQYGTDAPYQAADGVFSEDADRADYEAAIDMGEWIRDAGLAYALTREGRYARRAIDLLRHWFVDPETRMAPSAVNFGPHQEGFSGQHSIEHYITIPTMFYGASFVAGHPYWEEVGGADDLDEWAREFVASAVEDGTFFANNVGAWQVAARATVASYADDGTAVSAAFDDWRNRVLGQVTPEGGLAEEQDRSRSLFYSVYALKALALTAEVARHRGVDLYGHTIANVDGPVLRAVADFHAPFVLDPSTWPHQELGGIGPRERAAAASVYELLHSKWRAEQYLAVVRSAGRPVREERLLGNVTLTHANRFALDVPAGVNGT